MNPSPSILTKGQARRLSIDKATAMLAQRGISLNFLTCQTDLTTKVTSYELTFPNAEVKRHTTDQILAILSK